jgi:hypothetical protein
MRADAADARPTGPAPATSTVDPALTLVVTAPWKSGRQNIGEAGQTKDLFSGPRERLRTANEDAGDRQAAAADHAKPYQNDTLTDALGPPMCGQGSGLRYALGSGS